MSDITIPFNKPAYLGTEEQYISEVLHSGHQSGDGVFTKKCNAILEQALGAEKVLLTTNCTHALEMAAILLDIQPGDEVIIPSFTFVSTVNAFVLRGAKPVFVDIRPDTLNLDETQLERLITPKTRTVVPVHYAGVGCEMDEIGTICKRYNLKIVEDNAHGLFGKYKDRWLGTFGVLATQSFHETKNFSCGEGGALVINDPALKERAEIIREKGTNRSRFFRGQVDKYTWVDIGSSYLPSETLAAVLYSQLEARHQIQQRRGEIWHLYNQELKKWSAANQVQLPFIPADREQTYHMFYLLLPNLETRTRFIQTLRENGIYSVFHYLPLHLSDMGRKFGGQDGDCPVTEEISDRLVRLPLFYNLTASDQEFILETITRFRA